MKQLGWVISVVMASIEVVAGAPGDMDPSFQWPADDPEQIDNKVVAVTVEADGKPIVQLQNGTVHRLMRNGAIDPEFNASAGLEVRDHRGSPSLRQLDDGGIFALYPPRILTSNGEASEPLTLTDREKRVTASGAILADGSVLLADAFGIRTLLEANGEVGSIDPSLPTTYSGVSGIRWNQIYEGGSGHWFVIGSGNRSPNMIRITPDGALDTSFSPPDRIHTAVVAGEEGKVYVATSDGRGAAVSRLLNDGTPDSTFPAVPISFEPGWEVRELIYEPVTGSVFAGIKYEFARSSSSVPESLLVLIHPDGTISDYFGSNLTIQGSVEDMALLDGDLYVAGDFTHKESGAPVASLVRLDARITEPAPPLVVTAPDATVVPRRNRISLEVDAVAFAGALSYQWFKDGAEIAGANSNVWQVAHAEFADSGRYYVTVTGIDGEVSTPPVDLYVSGLVSEFDPDFASTLTLSFPSADRYSPLPIVLPDGKIILPGPFTEANGLPTSGLIRLNADGSLDSSFPLIHEQEIQFPVPGPDGSLLGGEGKNVVRRNSDGTFDTIPLPSGFADTFRFFVQPDGKLIIAVREDGNQFDMQVHRLLPDGQPDLSFAPIMLDRVGEFTSALVGSVAFLDEGAILASGQWGGVNGEQSSSSFNKGLMRLNADGSIDRTFDVSQFGSDFDSSIHLQTLGDHIVLSDGTIAHFMNLDGTVTQQSVEFVQADCYSIRSDNSGNFYGTGYDADHQRVYSRFGTSGEFLGNLDLKDRSAPARDVSAQFTPNLDGVIVSGTATAFNGIPVPNRLLRIRSTASVPIVFADSNLERALRDTLNLSPETPVTPAVLSSVVELNLDERDISDLRGLENASNLRALSLNNNRVSDLRPLIGLPLSILSVADNQIEELPDLDVDSIALDRNPLGAPAQAELLNIGERVSFELLPQGQFGQSRVAIKPSVVTGVSWDLSGAGQPVPSYQSGITLIWDTAAGRRYQFEESADMRSWTTIGRFGEIQGDGKQRTLSIATDGEGIRYYRIVEK
ncbi:MAG: hypothetical protein KDN22_26510 [Verrucomicrobiae bacterium]|nr:hypothetical protein [Verrucomicrobiae bacterium]